MTTFNSARNTICLFFIPNKDRTKIIEIIYVETLKLLEKLELDESIAKLMLLVKGRVPRSLNARARSWIVERVTVAHG